MTVGRLREWLFQAVTFDDFREIVAVLVAKAKGGDLAAIRELLNRLLGPPVELDLIERLEELERRLVNGYPGEIGQDNEDDADGTDAHLPGS